MNKGGRVFKVDPNVVLEVISKHKSQIFKDGKPVGPRNEVYSLISNALDGKMSPGAVYTFVKQNKRAKCMYSEWGLEETRSSEEDVPEDLTSKSTEKSDDDSSNESHETKGSPEIKEFIITLSTSEWSEMSPREFSYKDKASNREKVYKGLTPNVWTHIINEHFWTLTKLNCCLVFKRATVTDYGLHYVNIIGFCKSCKGRFRGVIKKPPSEGQRVLVHCKFTTSHTCTEKAPKRMVKGLAKRTLVSPMVKKNQSATTVRLQEANRLMEYGDKEPAHLPSSNALRCAKYKAIQEEYTDSNVFDALNRAKYTTPFKEVIQDIGLNKFFVRYWTPSQIQCYREHVSKNPSSVILIDATGGVVKKIPRPYNNKSAGVFIYQVRVVDEEKGIEFPAAQLISERHDNMAIYTWLHDWLQTGIPIPKTFVSDRSVALLSAAVKAFTQYKSLKEYITQCYNLLFLSESQEKPNCFIRCDIAHAVKNITAWPLLKGMPKNVRVFYIRTIVELLKATDVNIVKIILTELFKVCTSSFVGKTIVNGNITDVDTPAEEGRKNLKRLISDVHFEENIEELVNVMEGEESVCDSEVDEEYTQNLFKIWCMSIFERNDQRDGPEGEYENALYCPKIVKYVVDLVGDLPLISGVMTPIFGRGKATATSSRVESGFNTLKNIIFQDTKLPIRVDLFLTKHILALDGQLKLLPRPHKEIITHDEIELLPTDTSPTDVDCDTVPQDVQDGTSQSHVIGSDIPRSQNELLSPEKNEDLTRENWRGLGYTPKKNQTKNGENKRKLVEDSKPLKKIARKGIRSYLVRQPDLANVELPGKHPDSIGLLKNGNRASELKAILHKEAGNKKITLTNTCAFDSLVQIMACTYNDSTDKLFKMNFQENEDKNRNNVFLQLSKDVATKPISSTTYKKRIEILMAGLQPLDTYPGDVFVLNTECTVTTMVDRLLQTHPSFYDTHICTTQSCTENKTIDKQVLQVTVPLARFESFEEWIAILMQPQTSQCQECSGTKTVELHVYENWVFFELFETQTSGDSDILDEVKVIPSELPLQINIENKSFFLRGFVGFSGRRSSLDSIGHYTAKVRRSNGIWEEYDDTKNKKTSMAWDKETTCQLLVYSK